MSERIFSAHDRLLGGAVPSGSRSPARHHREVRWFRDQLLFARIHGSIDTVMWLRRVLRECAR